MPPAIPGVGAAPKFMIALLENDLYHSDLLAISPRASRTIMYLCCNGDADAAFANADNPGNDKLYLFCG